MLLIGTAMGHAAAGALKFAVSFDSAVRTAPASGRLVIYLIRPDARVSPMQAPADGFVEDDPQPMFGIDVANLSSGQVANVDDAATAFPDKLSALPPGKYRAQAVLDLSNDNSNWRSEPGNLFSDTIEIEITPNPIDPVKIDLHHVVTPPASKAPSDDVQIVEIRSKLLSDFRGKDVYLRAGVVRPVGFDPSRAYPAVYEVPGFGGDHLMAFYKVHRTKNRQAGSVSDELARNVFWIFLDPESGNGHTLFADSENNGPCARAMIEELIPALEEKFKLIPQASARIVTGHSSGGWSSVWLATQYPKVFGACWASSTDPVDFRRLELVDIYSNQNMYKDSAGREIPSARFDGGKPTMTVRQENAMENVLGLHNNSAQQWDSWQAAWGRRLADGSIAPLFDPISGRIDREVAESYRRFDIADRFRKDPARFVPIFRNNIRLICGDADTYYLNEAVKLLKSDLDQLDPIAPTPQGTGYIKLVAGADHDSIFTSNERQNWPVEIMEHLHRAGLVGAK